ncbi:MAG: helix-turn-helix domain-containing protein [Treponema sp.]|jgi:AraC-like DNA-binding protein/ligand-binding sensor protein|nr:helix-turn-helix domain-containing protein [Treponema sp.]
MQIYNKINAGTAENGDRQTAAPGTIINRREIGPLLQKAEKILKSYEQATGSVVSILDPEGRALDGEDCGSAFFCPLYKRCHKHYRPDREKEGDADIPPCACMSPEETAGIKRTGGSCIYRCKMGFVYWTSPIHSGGRFAGSLVAGRVLGVERKKAVENIYRVCHGNVSENGIRKYLVKVPEKTLDEIRAQARLLQICAKKIPGKTFEDTLCQGGTAPEPDLPGEKEAGVSPAKKRSLPGNSGRGRFLDRERLLLASLRRGDRKPAMKILNEIFRSFFASGSMETLRLWAIEMVVFLSRANPKRAADQEILEANGRYIKWIEDSKTAEELALNLRTIIERMAGNVFCFQGIRHSSALRKAERFIWENYTRKISLREIAEASGLSAPYFSTIFKEEMGESLSNYLNRMRIEKAAAMLAETDKTLNETADECGFEDQSWFSKIFKHYTGVSPGKYRETGRNETDPFFPIEAGGAACYAD